MKSVTSATYAAAKTIDDFFKSAIGLTTTLLLTPATRAGIAFIKTDDGYIALPPGT